MNLGDLIAPDGIIPLLKAETKKQALIEMAARAAALTGLDARTIFDTLLQRERLGSTGFGHGIAIPHVKLAGPNRLICLFANLQKPIDFESIDGAPVDLIFLLIAPEHASGDHLKALARISRIVRAPRALEQLRAAQSVALLHALLCDPVVLHAA